MPGSASASAMATRPCGVSGANAVAAEFDSVNTWFSALNFTARVLCQKGVQVVPHPTDPVSVERNWSPSGAPAFQKPPPPQGESDPDTVEQGMLVVTSVEALDPAPLRVSRLIFTDSCAQGLLTPKPHVAAMDPERPSIGAVLSNLN